MKLELLLHFFLCTQHDASLWNIAFSTTAAMYCVAGLLFLFFGSGKIQEWNNAEK